MKDGKCPKCKSATVYTKREGIKLGDGFYISDTSWAAGKSIKEIDHYLCTTCGYFETYVENKARLEQVAKDWKKVG